MQLWSSSNKLLLDGVTILCIGPIVKNGIWYSCLRRAKDDCSRHSVVFQMIAEDDFVVHALEISCSISSKSVKLAMGKSLNLSG